MRPDVLSIIYQQLIQGQHFVRDTVITKCNIGGIVYLQTFFRSQDISESHGSLSGMCYLLYINLVIIVLLGCLVFARLLLSFVFVVRFVALCVYSDTEESKYLELKHINQSINNTDLFM